MNSRLKEYSYGNIRLTKLFVFFCIRSYVRLFWIRYRSLIKYYPCDRMKFRKQKRSTKEVARRRVILKTFGEHETTKFVFGQFSWCIISIFFSSSCRKWFLISVSTHYIHLFCRTVERCALIGKFASGAIQVEIKS